MSAKRHSEKEKLLVNAVRRENLQLDRTIRYLNLQCKKELANMTMAQLELRKSLERLTSRQESQESVSSRAPGKKAMTFLHSFAGRGPDRSQHEHYCPNHILCSKCNLRMRLADTITRQFTPSLWTMYSNVSVVSFDKPLPYSMQTHRPEAYRIPSFVVHRHLSATENSLRYLPFIS
ncbi:hypothetical protein AOXY_G9804 [Acipenser oxyrinchus oxyrinchus]|uniref:Uncharacterized protein n=1 Tax=Acipenser oxyrinchus oxyrinchus TaxID=40147 RepID=A0AAD8DGH0_ACIOX|nr:hypothetical protein AOXY_G9804 [Acipenser oxyrinchus oxyrinchus]